jgi:hypothetical protein
MSSYSETERGQGKGKSSGQPDGADWVSDLSDANSYGNDWLEACDYEMVRHYLEREFPQLQFELRDGCAAERKSVNRTNDSAQPVEFAQFCLRAQQAFDAVPSLLSPTFVERLALGGRAIPMKLEFDFFGDAYFNLQEEKRVPFCSPIDYCAADREPFGPMGKVTPIFELTMNPTLATYKLDLLEIGLAFYRAYNAVRQVDSAANGAGPCWVLTNSSPERANAQPASSPVATPEPENAELASPKTGRQQIVSGVVVPQPVFEDLKRWRVISQAAKLWEVCEPLGDYINLKLFGCVILPSKAFEAGRDSEDLYHVCRLRGSDPRGEAAAEVYQVKCKPYSKAALRGVIKDKRQLPCPTSDIQVYDDQRRPFKDIILPNEASKPYFYYAPQFWVQGPFHGRPAVELDRHFPTTIGQLKRAIKDQFGLACDAARITLVDHGGKADSDPVEPCDETKPYVFREPRFWVRACNEEDPRRLDGFPTTLGELKQAIKDRFRPSCPESLIRVQFPRSEAEDKTQRKDSDPVEPCDETIPYVFREPRFWVREYNEKDPSRLDGFPTTLSELKQAIKDRFRPSCPESLIRVQFPRSEAEDKTQRKDSDPVGPCEPEKPYVFSEPRWWVKAIGGQRPRPLRSMPRDIYDLRQAIKERYQLDCDEECISVEGVAEDADWIPPNDKENPMMFRVLSYCRS